MNQILKIAILICFPTGMAAANGNRIGNGGKGIDCGKGSHREIQLLDFYESSTKIPKDLSGLTREATVNKVVENLKRVAPTMAKVYEKRAAEIMNEIEFKEGAILTETQDSFQLTLPAKANCHLKQIAIRRTETDALTKTFLFSKDLWSAMKPEQQAGLLVHEMVYEHFWKLGEKDSVKARKVTAYLFSEKAQKDTPDEFWKMIQSLKLPIYR